MKPVRRIHRFWFAPLALLVGWPLGCGGESAHRVGGETNWLSRCRTNADCRVGECLCGACSETCEADNGCSGLEGAGCTLSGEAAFSAQCGATAEATSGVCLPECTSGADCGADQRCVDTKCVFKPSAGSATCPDGSDGSRFGDQSPAPTDTYLQDCENPLAREYYRVFETEAGSAYIYPPPGASQTIIAACTDEGSAGAIATLLDQYGLCESSDASGTNAMTPDDAMALARYLHQKLVFAPSPDGVVPPALASDLYQACLEDPAFAAGVMSERCAFEIDAVESGERTEQGWSFTTEQAIATALALDALYGISHDDECERLGSRARFDLSQGLANQDQSCSEQADCILAGSLVSCVADCGQAASVVSEAERESLAAEVEAGVCAAYAEAGCPQVYAIPCLPTFVDCVDGFCKEVEAPG